MVHNRADLRDLGLSDDSQAGYEVFSYLIAKQHVPVSRIGMGSEPVDWKPM